MSTVRVRDFMTTDVLALKPETALNVAADMFRQRRISGAPVIDSGRKPVGVVSLADLIGHAPEDPRGEDEAHGRFYRLSGDYVVVHEGEAPGERPVSEVMSTPVLTVQAAAPLISAGKRMTELGVHRLVVVDEGRLVGMCSSLDMIRGLLSMVP